MNSSASEVANLGGPDEYWFRPDELLVHHDDSDPAAEQLERLGYTAALRLAGGSVLFRAGRSSPTPVPEAVRLLRSAPTGAYGQNLEGGCPRVSPNYLFGPCVGRVPRAAGHAESTTETLPPLGEPGGFTVGVVDTGIVLHDDEHNGVAHPWLASHVHIGEEGDDVLAPPGGFLGDADAHGTFVAGLVLREAPTAAITMIGALERADGTANVDDARVAAAVIALGEEGVKLINLSMCGYTGTENTAPPEIERAIAALDDDVVVVAAAGNDGDCRPVWPAALKRVIAVGAVGPGLVTRAGFSNYGAWVDAYASGVGVLGPYCWRREEVPASGHACGIEDCWHRSPGAAGSTREPQRFVGWARWSGTSFAAATVTGRIARTAVDDGVNAVEAARRVLRSCPMITIGDDPTSCERPYVAGRDSASINGPLRLRL